MLYTNYTSPVENRKLQMPSQSRLQPIEIHESLQRVLEAWESHASDTSFSEILRRDGRELGLLNAALGQANVAWSMSSILGELASRPEIMASLRPPPSDIPADVFFFMQADALASNSILYRTFVSVVLGRTEEFVNALSRVHRRNPRAHFSATMNLLRNDEVRRLRNAISHGTFLVGGQVLEYWDRKNHRKISFRELDKVNGAIWSIVLTGLVASYDWIND
ncbi:hypothetical protein [Futiania mangrovi]|uniref:Uncharacterized protein n=1 Tax=Futiania mangrovi TaxID=2959716 RepID=A0A9J6P9T8_9PROT|nr:hypothetical protein [Futiania mangrovii]MCP1335097.1 hypothetical protein [Futiania mangrovii]